MKQHEYSVADEIADVRVNSPHVIILGAGASLAALPNGDKNGLRLPVMANFVEVVGLEPILIKYGIAYTPGDNFEQIYSDLSRSGSMGAAEIEVAVSEYFSRLQLPDYPTIYDDLVLSLRSKDFIATFNWDPFLYQACYRNHKFVSMPRVAYLHGSVAVGFCEKDRRKGMKGSRCSVCGEIFTPTRLLYPIDQKNYNSDAFIKGEWSALEGHLKHAFFFTIFGYGAPKSDVDAIALMKRAWGQPEQREMEQTEIVDIRDADELASNWDPFIHSHHYEVHDNFFDSWIANHPRRSCEAAWAQYYDAKFVDKNPIPTDLTFPDLYGWLSSLTSVETAAKT
jgi:hypothetical protein